MLPRPQSMFQLAAVVLLLVLSVSYVNAAPDRSYPPAPPKASEGEVMSTIEGFLRSTLDDPDSYEPIDFSHLVLFLEDESKAYKWGMRHTYRVAHPQYGVLYVDRIFFIAYDGMVESVIEYNFQPCIDCKW